MHTSKRAVHKVEPLFLATHDPLIQLVDEIPDLLGDLPSLCLCHLDSGPVLGVGVLCLLALMLVLEPWIWLCRLVHG